MAGDGRSDEELLGDFVAGDRDAFPVLVRRHEDRLFALAMRMTGNRADALDATQDAFVAAFRRARSFRGDAAFGTWLYRIAINACQDLLRRRKPESSRDADETAEDPIATGASARVEDVVGARVDLVRALAELPEEYREALVMHDLGGVPYEEIALLTETKIGTVKSRISRGRQRLAELLEHPGVAGPSKTTQSDSIDGAR